MKKQWLSFLRFSIALSVIVSSLPAADPEPREKELLKIFHSISSHDLQDMVRELTSAKYNGRLSGTPEYIQCAEWVAARLKESGIQPVGDNQTFFQSFPEPFTTILNPGSLSLWLDETGGKRKEKPYSFPAEFLPGCNSDSGIVEAETVYVGYGITAPELKYDDYRGMRVKGKIVVVETGIPYEKEDENQEKWAAYSSSLHKLINAFRHGAAGMLYIGNMSNPNTPFQRGFVYCHIGEEVMADLLSGTSMDHQKVKDRIVKTQKPHSFSFKKRVTLRMSTEHHAEGMSCNVVGMIPGSDPTLKDEVIVFGGHLDGQGNPAILMPSALDNASGSVDLLAAAQALGHLSSKPKRTLLFIFFGGEERGLTGSRLYCEKPLFRKEKTVCMFNLDMVGNGTGLSLGGGLSYPLISRHFAEANQKYLHRNLRLTPSRKSYGRPRSDGAVFSRSGFSTLGIGTSERVKEVFYHDPRDTMEMLTPEIMEDVAKWIFLSAASLADADKVIE